MKPVQYELTAEKSSPYLGPKMLSHLCNTDEFIYRVIYYPLIQTETFDIYNDVKSRPPLPPQVCFSLLYLKEQYHLSRENVVNNLRFNQAWQLAMGTLYMGESIPGSDKTVSRFLQACEDHEKAHGLNPIDITIDRFSIMNCAFAGIYDRLTRTDSTPVSGAFTIQSREGLMYLAILKGVEYITCSADTEQAKAVRACDRLAKYEDANFTLNRISDRWPASQEKRREMLCRDADALLEIYHKDEGDCKEKTVWETIISQQTKIDESGVRVFAEKGDAQLNSTIVQSILDAEATYRYKNGKSLWGYVINALEAANEKAHFTIASCLYPNVTTDSDMANELNQLVRPFFEQVDEVYDKYPALKKGDPQHCQAVMHTIIEGMKADFIAEGSTLYEMSLSGASSQELTLQLQRQMAILDSFYDRLSVFDPTVIPPTEDVSLNACSAHPGMEQKDPCSKAVKDWSNYGGAPLKISDPDFANLSDGERRNIILNEIASRENLGSASILEGCTNVGDGGYSPSIEKAKELGINLLTTTLLGKKGNPIAMLFSIDGEEPTCPMGHKVSKISSRKNGDICVWISQDHCTGCPCFADCKAHFAKTTGLATVILKPNTFPAILSEAMILTDEYQKLADFRNGSEALMSLFHNFYQCDRWPIGMGIKRQRLKFMVLASNIRNLVLFINGKTRIHSNPTVYGT